MSRVLVTGGTGFVGSQLVRELEPEYDEVFYTYRSEPLPDGHAKALRLDLADALAYGAYARELQSVTHLVHAAAAVEHNREDVLQDLDTQVVRSVAGLENLLGHLPNLKKIVYVSSVSAASYADDPTFYGLGKYIIEETVSRVAGNKGLQYNNLRFPQIYGLHEPHGIFITKFLHALKAGQPIRLENNGAVCKDVLYIDDVTAGIRKALQYDASGIFTITDEQHTVREVLDILASALGTSPQVENVTVEADEIARKSFHFEDTGPLFGYHIQYNLTKGISALVKQLEKEDHV